MPTGWTTAERDALRAALASGATSVSYGEKSVSYRTFAEMRILLNEMNNEIDAVTRKKFIRTTTQGDRGY